MKGCPTGAIWLPGITVIVALPVRGAAQRARVSPFAIVATVVAGPLSIDIVTNPPRQSPVTVRTASISTAYPALMRTGFSVIDTVTTRGIRGMMSGSGTDRSLVAAR